MTNDHIISLKEFASNLTNEQYNISYEFEEVFRENFLTLLSNSVDALKCCKNSADMI